VAVAELEKRQTEVVAFESPFNRGWEKLYVEHVMQADKGVDLDFLVGGSGSVPPKVSH
jgi:L-arabonate dehydrase